MEPALEQRIRDAVASGDFAGALALWQEYAASLRDQIEAGTASEVQMKAAIELIRSVTAKAASAREQAACKLGESRAAGAYAAMLRKVD
jgi:hypothetical protein